MDGIATILENEQESDVRGIWKLLENECSLAGIQNYPIPHFTWHLAESYNEEMLVPLLKEFCTASKPFIVRTSGLGVFIGEHLVIYLALVKDRSLLEFHQRLWELITPYGYNSVNYYSPEFWVPHITLAVEGTITEFICAMKLLAAQPVLWEFEIRNLAVIGQNPLIDKNGECYRFALG